MDQFLAPQLNMVFAQEINYKWPRSQFINIFGVKLTQKVSIGPIWKIDRTKQLDMQLIINKLATNYTWL